MPDTPQFWAPAQPVTFVAGSINAAPDIVQLEDGRLLVSWETDDPTQPGHPDGLNVLGRSFSPIGEVLAATGYPGGTYPLDVFSTNVGNASIAKVSGNDRTGLILAFEVTSLSDGRKHIKLQELDAAGGTAQADSNSVQIDTIVGAPNYINPDIVVSDASHVLITYQITGVDGAEDSKIVGRIYDTISNKYTNRFAMIDQAGSNVFEPRAAALKNDTFVVVASHETSGRSEGLFTIIDNTGTILTSVTVIGSTPGSSASDRGFAVAATGTPVDPGFVVVWQSEGTGSDVWFQTFDATGTIRSAAIATGGGGNDADVLVLRDGGFVVTQVTSSGLDIRRYDDDGTAVGNPVQITGDITDPASTQMEDGRFAITWVEDDAIMLQILDGRDAPSLGFHLPSNWHVGTNADDAIVDTVFAVFTTIHGWHGNDIITTSGGGPRAIYGDGGDDLITATNGLTPFAGDGTDAYHGGDGTDHLDFSRVIETGLVFDLRTEELRQTGTIEKRAMTGFENVTTTPDADIIFGNSLASRFATLAGDDTITPGTGNDTVLAGDGVDTLNLSATISDVSADLKTGSVMTGTDQNVVSSVENLITGSGNDRVSGNNSANTLETGDGDDRLYGDGLKLASVTETSAQVFRLYHATLGRDPDAAGHLDWTTKLSEGHRLLYGVSAAFVASAEFQNTYAGLDDIGFVTLLYNNVLNRAADTGGLATWTGRLAGGMIRAEVVLGFSESQEFVASSRAASTAYTESQTDMIWSDDVFRLYRATLARDPDLAGFQDWTGKLGSGTAFLTAVTGFVGSQEFQNTYGSLNDTDFVQLLYTNVLARSADAAGLADWQSRLASETTREMVVQGFSQSQEFVTATQSALKTWIRQQRPDDVLDAGDGDNVLSGGILSDTFVFHSHDDGTNLVMDLEPWDYLQFSNFGFSKTGDAQNVMTETGGDVVFSSHGVTVIFADTTLAGIVDDMIL